MARQVTKTLEITLPDDLEARAVSRAMKNGELDRLDAYRMDYVTLEFEFTNDDPETEENDFLRA